MLHVLSCFSTALELATLKQVHLQISSGCFPRNSYTFLICFLYLSSSASTQLLLQLCMAFHCHGFLNGPGFAVVPPRPARCGFVWEVEKLSVTHIAQLSQVTVPKKCVYGSCMADLNHMLPLMSSEAIKT